MAEQHRSEIEQLELLVAAGLDLETELEEDYDGMTRLLEVALSYSKRAAIRWFSRQGVHPESNCAGAMRVALNNNLWGEVLLLIHAGVSPYLLPRERARAMLRRVAEKDALFWDLGRLSAPTRAVLTRHTSNTLEQQYEAIQKGLELHLGATLARYVWAAI